MTPQELLDREIQSMGRGATLVGEADIAGVTFIVYDMDPLAVYGGKLGDMLERRFAVALPDAKYIATSGIVSHEYAPRSSEEKA